MLLGIDIRSICREKAGIGTHFYELLHALAVTDRQNDYLLYTDRPFDEANKLPGNMRVIKMVLPAFLWHPAVAVHAKLAGIAAFLTPSCITSLLLGWRMALLYIPDVSGLVLKEYHTRKVVLLSVLYTFAVRKAAAVLTISDYSKREIAQTLKLRDSRIFVVKLGVSGDFKVIHEEPLLTGFRNSKQLPAQFILFVGSVEPRKNISGLITALQHIAPEKRPKLVVAGGKGWKNSELYKHIKENNLDTHILFLGYLSREDLVLLYNTADVFVFPSFYEGFGMPVLEAMACGTPVVCSQVSSIPEIAGDAALFFDPKNSEEIAAAILRATSDSLLRKEMKIKGLINAEKYRWTQAAEKTVDVFSAVHEKNRSRFNKKTNQS
jgi:glycosyltransferase involved in cell wall biosynthesis